MQEKYMDKLNKEYIEILSGDGKPSESVFFRSEPSEVSKESRLKFIALKTLDVKIKDKLSLYCKVLNVSLKGRKGAYERARKMMDMLILI